MLLCQVAQIRAIVCVVTTTPIAAVLGANCRRIRTDAEVTQDELARAARQFGLKWTASKVRDFEAGRSGPTFATVLALAAALDNVTNGEPVRLADLVSFDGGVTITEDFEPDGQALADYCSGGTWEHCAAADRFLQLSTGNTIDWRQSVIDWPKVLGLTEERVAAGLGISTDQLCDVSLRLWNTTFSAERDRIAGPDANAQRKGQVTRQLKAQLEKALTDGDD
jgi:transcriptional regulator with XRE-family HTH domain